MRVYFILPTEWVDGYVGSRSAVVWDGDDDSAPAEQAAKPLTKASTA